MKLSQLTPEQKTRLLAELDGHSFEDAVTGCMRAVNSNGKSCGGNKHQFFSICAIAGIPDYLTSYDAIIPLVQKLWKAAATDGEASKAWAIKFIQALYPLHTHPECDSIDLQDAFDDCHQAIYLAMMLSTPSQLCDAVLVATGKVEV